MLFKRQKQSGWVKKKNDTTITFKVIKAIEYIEYRGSKNREICQPRRKKNAVRVQYCGQAMLLYGQFS